MTRIESTPMNRNAIASIGAHIPHTENHMGELASHSTSTTASSVRPSLVDELETAKILHELSTGLAKNVSPSPPPVIEQPQRYTIQRRTNITTPSSMMSMAGINRGDIFTQHNLQLHQLQAQLQAQLQTVPQYGVAGVIQSQSRKRSAQLLYPSISLPNTSYCLPTSDSLARETKMQKLDPNLTLAQSQHAPLLPHIVEDDLSSLESSTVVSKGIAYDEMSMASTCTRPQMTNSSLHTNNLNDSASAFGGPSSHPFLSQTTLKVMPLSPPPALPPVQCFPTTNTGQISSGTSSTISYVAHNDSKNNLTTTKMQVPIPTDPHIQTLSTLLPNTLHQQQLAQTIPPSSMNNTTLTSDTNNNTKPVKRKICRMEACTECTIKRSPYCKKHAGPRKCEHMDCHKFAQGRTRFCIAHGGGQRCIVPGCNKGARDKKYCASHGGGRRCTTPGCTKLAVGGLMCTAHGGGKRCQHSGCKKSAQSNSEFCVRHGGGKRCHVDGCIKVARGKSGLCMSHATERSEMGKLLAQYYADEI